MATKRKVTNLTEVANITCVIQKGLADGVNASLLDVGVQGATVHYGVGTGVRERMGILGIAVDVEREIMSVLVPMDQVDRIFERIFLAAQLDTPWQWLHFCHAFAASRHLHPAAFAQRLSNTTGVELT
jgi:nitrogen regulatory protein P-II 1